MIFSATEYNAAIVSFIFRSCNFTTFFRCCTLMSTLLESIERSHCLLPKNRMNIEKKNVFASEFIGIVDKLGGRKEDEKGDGIARLRRIHSLLLFGFGSFKCKRFESTRFERISCYALSLYVSKNMLHVSGVYQWIVQGFFFVCWNKNVTVCITKD